MDIRFLNALVIDQLRCHSDCLLIWVVKICPEKAEQTECVPSVRTPQRSAEAKPVWFDMQCAARLQKSHCKGDTAQSPPEGFA